MGLHDPVLKEKIVGTAAVQVSNALKVPNLMQKESFDRYKGAKDGTVDVTVEGVLPWHTYPWRQDPSDRESIVWDVYKERTVGVSLGQHLYSGVQLIDEQKDLDLLGWAKLTGKQADAASNGVNYKAADFISDSANFDVVATVNSGVQAYDALLRLRKIAKAMHMPGSFTLACGSDWENYFLETNSGNRLNLASNVGDALAQTAVQEATLGRRLGFNIFVIDEMDPADAIVFGSQAFIFANAAPSVPDSIPFGARGSADGISLRVLRDYDPTTFVDRSVVDTWYGFRTVKDVLATRVLKTDDSLTVSKGEYNIRALKATLDSGAVELNTDNSNELGSLTGLTTTSLTIGDAIPADSSSSSSSSSSAA